MVGKTARQAKITMPVKVIQVFWSYDNLLMSVFLPQHLVMVGLILNNLNKLLVGIRSELRAVRLNPRHGIPSGKLMRKNKALIRHPRLLILLLSPEALRLCRQPKIGIETVVQNKQPLKLCWKRNGIFPEIHRQCGRPKEFHCSILAHQSQTMYRPTNARSSPACLAH